MPLSGHESAIRERAYAIWEAEGRPEGREWEHWRRAAQEVAGNASQQENGFTAAMPRPTEKAGFFAELKAALSGVSDPRQRAL